MAKQGIPSVTTGVMPKPLGSNIAIPMDETVGLMLFDISGFGDWSDTIQHYYFSDEKVVCVRNMEEAAQNGIIDDEFMNGVLYYSVSQYFKYLGEDKELYIVIADCSNGWSVIERSQRMSGGKFFQVAVWTHQPIWKKNTDETIGFTSLITDLQDEAEQLCGNLSKDIVPTNIPLSIILCGNGACIEGSGLPIRLKDIPDATALNCPKVSVVLAQNGTEAIHDMQSQNPNNAPVGAMGFILACLTKCGAEECIGSVMKCNLNKDDEFESPELGFGPAGTPVTDFFNVRLNTLCSYGYIIPTLYASHEGEVFFSSDYTLSEGDYGTIANNRIIHKCRRAVATALLPYINSNHLFNSSAGQIDASSMSQITTNIYTVLGSVMKFNGNDQIEGSTVEFLDNRNMLNSDAINLKLTVHPVNYDSDLTENISSTDGEM